MDEQLAQSLTEVAVEQVNGQLNQAKALLATVEPSKNNDENIRVLNQKILDTIQPDDAQVASSLSEMITAAIQNDETIEEVRLTQKLHVDNATCLDSGRLTPAAKNIVKQVFDDIEREQIQNETALRELIGSTLRDGINSAAQSRATSRMNETVHDLQYDALDQGRQSAVRSAAASRPQSSVSFKPTPPTTPRPTSTTDQTAMTPVVSELVSDAVDQGQKAASESRAASRATSMTPSINALVADVIQDGRDSAEISRAASAMTATVITSVETSTVEQITDPEAQTSSPSDAPPVTPVVESLVEVAIETGVESADVSRAASKLAGEEAQQPPPPPEISITPPVDELVNAALKEGERSANVSRVASVMADSVVTTVASEVQEDAPVIAEDMVVEALESGMRSAQRSQVESRMNGELMRSDTFTPTVMGLIEMALTDGRISAGRESIDSLPRMTPVVMKLIEEAIHTGHQSALASKTPSANVQRTVDVSMEERYHKLVDQLSLRSRQDDLTLTEFSSLTDELLEMTSILALFLRNGRKTQTISRRFYEIEQSLSVILEKLGNWDITAKNMSVMQQQITIAQTLLQATQLLETTTSLEDDDTATKEAQDESSSEGSDSSYTDDSDDESSSSRSNTPDSVIRAHSPSPSEVTNVIHEAMADGMLSAQRSAAASRVSFVVEIKKETEEQETDERTEQTAEVVNPIDIADSTDEKIDEKSPETPQEEEKEEDPASDSESNVTSVSAESVFTPPADLPGEKSIWKADLPLPLCIFTNTGSNGFTTVTTDDELLEHALGHLDESLSPVFVLDAAEADQHDYSLLIPYETAYRSPAREVSLRASRDGLKWIRIPTQVTEHETHEDVKFARVSTRRYSYVALVYSIRTSRLEVPSKGAMMKCQSDSRIYFQFPQKISKHKLVLNTKVTPISFDLVDRVKSDGDNCRQLISTSPIIEPGIPSYNFPLKKSYTVNCPCLFSQQLLKKNQLQMRRMSTFMGKDTSQLLQNVEAGYKIDEPVYLIVLNHENEWIIEKNIKLRESKKQQGLVSFDLNKPVRKLVLIRTDGALPDDRIIHMFNEILTHQTKHYVQILVKPSLTDPSDNICAVVNESQVANFDAHYGESSEHGYVNAEDDDYNYQPLREGQLIWFKVEGNVSILEGGNKGWLSVQYRRHDLAMKQFRLNYVNMYGNHTADSYRGVFRAYAAQVRPKPEKMDATSICTRPGDPPLAQGVGKYLITKTIGADIHLNYVYDRVVEVLPVTLPKIEIEDVQLAEPKLTRKPSLLDLQKAADEVESKADPAESLAKHLSEYESDRLAESLGIQKGNLGLMRKMKKPERLRTMIISWRRAEPVMTDTRTYLAAKLTEVGRGDLKNFVLKNGDTGIRKISGIKLPPIGTA